ncbi:MAG: hypothetical protein JW891_18425 [Candidatus Lokiarchaeota archaeon]|nr:hypothetical protein [Candidatus Lokiarchaeota archaeon]
MADRHSKSFFGRNAGLHIFSSDKTDPHTIVSCFKRKKDGTWENPLNGEGRSIHLIIEEMISFLEVLKGNHLKWSGYDITGEKGLEIVVSLDEELKQEVSIKIGQYEKKFKSPNLNVLRLLIGHIIAEKIEFATNEKLSELETRDTSISVFSERITTKDGYDIVETTKYNTKINKIEITAKIVAESPKALLISLDVGHEFWIPKNTIHSSYDIKKRKIFQQFVVDKWIIEKNLISMNYNGE